MFCPHCAAANSDQAKFCRACGMNLEAIALVLTGHLVPSVEASRKREWLEKRSKGVRETVAGGILLGLALLVLLVLFWIGIAVGEPGILAAWIGLGLPWAIWGFTRMAKGIPDWVESKMMLREMPSIAGGRVAAPTTELPPEAGRLPIVPGMMVAADQAPPLSITEHTTETLAEHHVPHPDMVAPKRGE